MSDTKSRREAIKLSLGVLVGLPAVSVLNACTQCSKPAADAPAANPAGATTDATPATGMGDAATGQQAGSAGGEGLSLVAETDPVATGLNYKHNKADVPANLQQEKSGTPFAEQNCSSCIFFKSAGQLDGAEVGSCQVIPSGKVKAQGWCASWGKKA